MRRINSLSTLTSRINEPLIFTLCASTRSTFAPISSIACNKTLMSRTFGKFSIVTVSSVIIDAARIARAAFFAPPISISPFSLFPPLITYCSISHLKNEMPLLIYYSLLLRLLFINSSFSIICSTVCSTFSPSSDIRISAYCSYNGVRSKNRS